MRTVGEVLERRPYPGRGCLAARTANGTLCFVYFLTGRSLASRNREPLLLDNGDVAVNGTGSENQPDLLRHYVSAARRGDWLVVGNGDQVVPLAEALTSGVSALTAWEQHTFEPDPPIFTSRIWVARRVRAAPDCLIGSARRSQRGDGEVDRVSWAVGVVGAAAGVVMTTYDGSTDDVRSTVAPQDVAVDAETPLDLVRQVWSALDPDLRVAAVAIITDDLNAKPIIVQ